MSVNGKKYSISFIRRRIRAAAVKMEFPTAAEFCIVFTKRNAFESTKLMRNRYAVHVLRAIKNPTPFSFTAGSTMYTQ